MARILYAWELGGDYGHIGSFMPLAIALRDAGHEVIFAIRDLSHAENVVAKHQFPILQAPIWHTEGKPTIQAPLNYSEILINFGFGNKLALSALNRAWLNLFTLSKAEFLIADHSPAALFSAYAIQLPRAVYGTGFCSPPHIAPTPNLRPWIKIADERLLASDQHVLKVSNSLLADMHSASKKSYKPLTMVADLFKVDVDFLCTLPEIDHFPQRSKAVYWGAVFNTSHGTPVTWPNSAQTTKRIFAYLKPQYKHYISILHVLKESGASVIIFSPGVSKQTIQNYQTETMQFYQDPVQLDSILKECDLAICHAGHGTMAACLMAGIPLLLLPMQIEQFLASISVKKMGAAEMIPLDDKLVSKKGQANPEIIHLTHNLLNKLSHNPSYQAMAQKFSQRYQKLYASNPYAAMVKQINKILQSRQV